VVFHNDANPFFFRVSWGFSYVNAIFGGGSGVGGVRDGGIRIDKNITQVYAFRTQEYRYAILS